MSEHFRCLLDQYQEKERYWKERCHYVEDQLNIMNTLKEMERSRQKNIVEDKDEIIRRLQAKIASRDAVIEGLEEKIAHKEKFARTPTTGFSEAQVMVVTTMDHQSTYNSQVGLKPGERMRSSRSL